MGETTINNTSDVGISCGKCGSYFAGQARYSKEVGELYNNHPCYQLVFQTVIEPVLAAASPSKKPTSSRKGEKP